LSFKKQVHIELERLQLPYALYFNGPFADWAVGLLGPKDGKITLVGKGETPTSFTKIGDSAEFIAYTLTRERAVGGCCTVMITWSHHAISFLLCLLPDLSPEELNGARFRLEGSRATFGELAKIYADSHPGTTIEYEDPAEALKRAVETKDFMTWLKVEWNAGGGTTYTSGQKTSNDLYPDWKPADVRDIVRAS
jgi:hypothetical protein